MQNGQNQNQRQQNQRQQVQGQQNQSQQIQRQQSQGQQVQRQQVQRQQVQRQQVQRQQSQGQQVQRQQSPSDLIQKQQMTEEELQRTQVLNFDDFKQVARYEKISSKKPAIIVALLGILALIVGGGYPVVQSQMAKKTEEQMNSTVQSRKKTTEVEKTKLTCVRSKAGILTGVDETLTIVYNFEDDKLTSFTKDLVLMKTSETGQTSLQGYLTALEPYLIQQDGYKMSVKQIDNGVSTLTSVDYKNLDVNKVPELNQQNPYFNIIYIADTKKEAINQDMTNQGYICS